jgi:hypothetical protein
MIQKVDILKSVLRSSWDERLKKLFISIRKVFKHVLPSPGEQGVHTTESHTHVPALDAGNKGTFVCRILSLHFQRIIQNCVLIN